ncbi:MAG: hypothetical protein A3K18_18025 [Lentisphaerae bacterium RIFOXYA12_64_32]|nr:MAG: hypothetical protein A3K18_18025 [Lentisphaerae bacterium RIFOXYA12_64_32]
MASRNGIPAPQHRVTIRDIAQALNISHSTVSRVLSGWQGGSISDATRQRVVEWSRRLGYTPNSSARALVTGKTGNIALFTPSLEERTGPHFARMLDAVERRSAVLGYRLLVCGQIEALRGSGLADGLIVLGAPDLVDGAALSPALHKVHVCHLSTPPDHLRNIICWSDFDGTRQGTEFLIAMGHRHILGVWGNIAPPPSPRGAKVEGHRAAMAAHGLVARERFGAPSSDQVRAGYLLMAQCLREAPEVTAVVARNDYLAVGCLQAVSEAGLKVPGDVSILGYNDTILAQYAAPPLSSVRTPIAAAGELAVELLHARLQDGAVDIPGRVLGTEVTDRGSCAPPRPGPRGKATRGRRG